jgi:hypothetical protein
MVVSPSSSNLIGIVFPHELKPDEWPRFRYILLELWRPTEERLSALVQRYRLDSRLDVVHAFYRQKVKIYCKDKGIEEKQIPDAQDAKLKKEAKNQFETALIELVGKLSEAELAAIRTSLDKAVPPTEEEIALPAVADEDEEV